MIIELDTTFTEEERAILKQYGDIDIKLFVDSEKLFDISKCDDPESRDIIQHPVRMLCVDDYYLLETRDVPGEWWMGIKGKDLTYFFWSNCGDLETTLICL